MTYDARRETILRAAGALFASKGYERTSIRDVARASGMSVAGLYYYVRSKEELLYHICDRSFSTILEALDRGLAHTTDPRERVRVLIRNHLSHFLRDMNAIKVITRELGALDGVHATRIAALRRRYYATCRAVLEGLGTHPVAARLAAMSLFGMINWIHMWYRPEVDGDADHLADGMARIFLDGYGTPSGGTTTWSRPMATSR
ncbi:MAG TPA: TetR/AcrR family transcriptional regulator [bacterium]|nr:TetR/AcrR family transcriptional regulator [bacterium]